MKMTLAGMYVAGRKSLDTLLDDPSINIGRRIKILSDEPIKREGLTSLINVELEIPDDMGRSMGLIAALMKSYCVVTMIIG